MAFFDRIVLDLDDDTGVPEDLCLAYSRELRRELNLIALNLNLRKQRPAPLDISQV